MTWNLSTIDWTAIGAIATVLAFIVAYLSIYISNKQNKKNQQFQLALIQRDIEQKRFDDLIECIMTINNSIQPINVMDYTKKLLNGTFAEADQSVLNGMAEKDRLDNIKLSIQLMKYDKNQSAKSLLNVLSDIHQIYGEWVRDLCLLSMYKKDNVVLPAMIKPIISRMGKISRDIDHHCEPYIKEALNSSNNDLDRAISLMNVFSSAVSSYLVDNKRMLDDELYRFAQLEQGRIDNSLIIRS